jgi:hypothetical protein
VAELYERHEHPPLVEPVLVMALDGWIDAGFGAANAAATMLRTMETVPVATFDADELLDHRARRPSLQLVDGVVKNMVWPSIELTAGTDQTGREVVVLTGSEPDHRWHAFVSSVVGLALDLGVRMCVGLGAYPAPAAHTRPIRIACTSTSEELASTHDFLRATLQVPAGVQAAVETACAEVGIPALGLWAQVPHYIATMPNPAASLALLEALSPVAGLTLDPGDLIDEATQTRARIDRLVAENPEHQQMVQALERQADEQIAVGPLPSGDELAAEVERFLREQGN